MKNFGIKLVDHFIKNESMFQMITYLMLKDNLANPVMGKFDSVTKIFFDLFEQLLKRHGVKNKDARMYSHSFIASLTGILMTFRNYPLKNKKAIRNQLCPVRKLHE